MVKKISITALFLIGFLTVSLAQESSQELKGNEKNNEFSRKFFLATTMTPYVDFIISPLKYHYAPTGNFILGGPNGDSSIAVYDDIPYQSAQFNIFSIGMEPRYNLKEFDENSSLSISAPISFGLGNSSSALNDDLIVRGVNGFGSIQIPLLLKLNIGNGSTYSTQKDFGFSAGAGIEMNKIGLINLTQNAKQYNRAFFIPALSAGFTFIRGNSPMEINFKYGFGKVRFQEYGAQGKNDILKDEAGIPYRRSARAQTIKLTFVYLMNY